MTVFQAASAAGLSIGAAATVANVAVAATAVAATVGVVELNKAMLPKLSAQPYQTQLIVDPQAPVPYAIGRTAVAGSVVMQTTSGSSGKYLLYYTALSAGGPHEAFGTFYANNEAVTFSADGGEGASGYYQNRMWIKRVLDAGAASYGGLRFTATGTKDTPADHSGNPSEWTTAHKATDYAMYLLALEYDTEKFSGVPIKPLQVGQWAKVYDPRLDSTYPGGSGSHRWADPSDATAFAAARATWTWSENPYIHALNWCLGRWSRTGSDPYRRVVGIGAPLSMIKVAQFVEGANVCDANGWTVGGLVTSSDSKWDVLASMLQAGGGVPLRIGGMIGCTVATPRVSIATLTVADLADGQIAVPGTRSRRDRINRIIPRYRSEDHNWEIVAADPVEVSDYVTADGGWRTQEVDFPLVQDVQQAAELATLRMVKAREFGPGSIPLKPRWMGLEPGDCVTIDIPEAGLSAQKVLIQSRSLDFETTARTLTFVSETDAGYDYVTGATGSPPAIPSLAFADVAPDAPSTSEWTATGETLTGSGASVPAIVITGATSLANVSHLVVRYRVNGSGDDWTVSAPWPIAYDTDATITLSSGLLPATAYDLELSYLSVRGVSSAWTTMTDVTTGAAVAPLLADQGVLATEDSVSTALIDANAVTNSAVASSSSSTTVSGWTALVSASLTTIGGSVTLNGSFDHYAVGGGSGNTIGYRFKRDGTVIHSFTWAVSPTLTCNVYSGGLTTDYVEVPQYSEGPVSFFYVDAGASAGAHTYALEAYSSGSMSVQGKVLAVLELRR